MRAATRKRIPHGRIKSLEAFVASGIFSLFKTSQPLALRKTSNIGSPPEDPSDAPFGASAPVMPSMKPQVVQVLDSSVVSPLDRKKTT